MARAAGERVVLTLSRENVCADIFSAPSLEIFDDRQPNPTDGFTLLAFLQPQATRLGSRLSAPAKCNTSYEIAYWGATAHSTKMPHRMRAPPIYPLAERRYCSLEGRSCFRFSRPSFK